MSQTAEESDTDDLFAPGIQRLQHPYTANPQYCGNQGSIQQNSSASSLADSGTAMEGCAHTGSNPPMYSRADTGNAPNSSSSSSSAANMDAASHTSHRNRQLFSGNNHSCLSGSTPVSSIDRERTTKSQAEQHQDAPAAGQQQDGSQRAGPSQPQAGQPFDASCQQGPNRHPAYDGSSSQCGSKRRRDSNSDSDSDDAASSTRPDLSHLTDMTNPAAWYPAARGLKRTIVAHLGPTNSGKTHAALQALKHARSGVYCGPLRLLACEVADRLNADGVPCDLLTGQETRRVPGARHTACTVEMASLDTPVDVAVIDEVQMLGDRQRGWGWTRALLGLQARTVHVCGDGSVLQLLAQLAAECGDKLQVERYRRLSPLVVMNQPLGSLEELRPGDCLVAFSRRSVYGLKNEIGRQSDLRTCLVYGALPPDARRQQAELFNARGPSAKSVLVARVANAGCSDAIGMGLNLNIRRVIFTALSKYDGETQRQLKAPEVKQIAGRAGRFRSAHSQGYVTTLAEDDLQPLHESLSTRSEPLMQACLLPRPETLAIYASHFPEQGYAASLKAFQQQAQLSGHYAFGTQDNMVRCASMLQHLTQLTPEEMYTFSTCPVDMDNEEVASALLKFATACCRRGHVHPSSIVHAPLRVPRSETELKFLEELHRVYDLYVWLGLRMPQQFKDRSAATRKRAACGSLIEQGLQRLATFGGKGGEGKAGKASRRRRKRAMYYDGPDSDPEDDYGYDEWLGGAYSERV